MTHQRTIFGKTVLSFDANQVKLHSLDAFLRKNTKSSFQFGMLCAFCSGGGQTLL